MSWVGSCPNYPAVWQISDPIMGLCEDCFQLLDLVNGVQTERNVKKLGKLNVGHCRGSSCTFAAIPAASEDSAPGGSAPELGAELACLSEGFGKYPLASA